MDSNRNELPLDQVSRTELMRAIEENDPDLVLELLDKNVDGRNLDLSDDNALLHRATKNQCLEIMKILLNRGAPVDAYDTFGRSPLFYAVQTMNDAVINLIMRKLLSKSTTDNGVKINYNPALLLIACLRKDILTVERLVTSGDIKADDPLDTTSFCISSEGRTPTEDKVPILKWTCLRYHYIHVAVELGNMNLVDILLKYGANAKALTLEMLTALHLAAKRKDPYIVDSIIRHYKKIGKYLDLNLLDDFGNTPLILAVESGPLETVELLLNNEASVHIQNSDGNTALHLGAQNDCLYMVQVLLIHGGEVNVVNSESRTPLHLAAKNKPLDINPERSRILGIHLRTASGESQMRDRKRLLNLMAAADQSCYEKVNPTDDRGFSHFHAACMTDNAEVIECFLENGVNVNQAIDSTSEDWPGYTPLHFAVENDCLNVVKLLLQFDANPNAKDQRGMTPLHIATHHLNTNCIKMLLSNKIRVNARNLEGNTALHTIVQGDDKALVRQLLEKGADVSIRNRRKLTPLHLAARNELLDRVTERRDPRDPNMPAENPRPVQMPEKKKRDKLLSLMSSYDRCCYKKINPTDERGFSHFHAACMRDDENNCRNVEVFLKNGVKVNKAISNRSGEWAGYTALHFAAKHNSWNVIRLLIKHGANKNARDAKGMTPLHIAARNLHYDSVQTLLELEADANARDLDGNNVLCDMLRYHWLKLATEKARELYIMIVEVLLDTGCDPNTQNNNGDTALHMAFCYYEKRTVEYLVCYGADINIKNNENLVPVNSVPCFCAREEAEESDRAPACHLCKDIRENIIKLRALEFEVNQENLDWFARQAQRNARVNTVYEQKCLSEIVTIKAAKNDQRSLYDIFSEEPRGMGKYIFSEGFKEMIEADNFHETYPIYGHLIKNQFRRGLYCKENFLRPAASALSSILGLPDLCCTEIAKYLSVNNLWKLVGRPENDAVESSSEVNLSLQKEYVGERTRKKIRKAR